MISLCDCILIFIVFGWHFYMTVIMIIRWSFMSCKFIIHAKWMKTVLTLKISIMIWFCSSKKSWQTSYGTILSIRCTYTFQSKVVINKISWFLGLPLYFDLYASLIVLILCDTSNILRAIVLLFFWNFFQSINFFRLSYSKFFRSFWCTYFVSKEETKLICIVNWIFHSPKLWLFIKSRKYSIIIKKYSLTDNFLSLSHILCNYC